MIETKRLCLRPFTEDDIPRLHEIFSDRETMAHYPSPFSYEKTEAWVRWNQESYEENGFGLWAVCLQENQTLIGDCGLVKQTVDGCTEVEVGYHIDKNHWSQGFGSEAAFACKNYAFKTLGLNRIISIVAPDNMPSRRVAEKIGLREEKESFVFGKNHVIYSGEQKVASIR
ncbi:GNAT family N-acetyltransferase [Shouchella lonarensis]|uniref:Protein N-acetyltransferase, RimJ/RimL family n=1 Tax=Shouchella lonarensis TaxID=1464122 RepID=A0A1G6PFP4_9BACI|nr:GNAT family N-acetyltransferase [Shouchella lonarensis]SDC78838.1 Protein N-acetyltransferase, RimJ/RimL family [Shouchella lonarensis]